jgi:hypothetical protein
VITASQPSWIAPFSGLSPRQFGKLITALRREGADPVRKGRPWSLPLEDRVLLVAAYWRTNLTLRQPAPLFGMCLPVSMDQALRLIPSAVGSHRPEGPDATIHEGDLRMGLGVAVLPALRVVGAADVDDPVLVEPEADRAQGQRPVRGRGGQPKPSPWPSR